MIEFTDAYGDKVRTFINVGRSAALEGTLAIECISSWNEDDYEPLALTRDMARALATDLLAFADSTPETMENEG